MPTTTSRIFTPLCDSASEIARSIERTVFSILVTTPRESPSAGAWPTPRIVIVCGSRKETAATMAHTFVVPTSRPTMMRAGSRALGTPIIGAEFSGVAYRTVRSSMEVVSVSGSRPVAGSRLYRVRCIVGVVRMKWRGHREAICDRSQRRFLFQNYLAVESGIDIQRATRENLVLKIRLPCAREEFELPVEERLGIYGHGPRLFF